MLIRPALPSDAPAIWSIMEPVIRAGETYTFDREMTESEGLAQWLAAENEVFVVEVEGAVVGTYTIHPNRAGGGRHICNCSFMTQAGAMGRGVGRRMGEHALAHARSRGYRGMQFNFVVSSNERAVRLWQNLGFETVGRLPLAFHHPTLGYVDALVMFQAL